MPRPTVLLIGGSDSSGGAGIARDIQVLADHATDAAVAITAVTAQTDAGVLSIHPVPAGSILEQIASALESRDIAAIKIGMLGGSETVQALIEGLPSRDAIPIVLDPVLSSSSGTSLLDEEGRKILGSVLFPRVTLVTPNIPEAAALLGVPPAADEQAMHVQAQRMRSWGAEAVLLKGGHASGAESVDLLMSRDGSTERFSSPRIPVNVRGTGCMLASAIAAALANGMRLTAACDHAKRYVSDVLRR